VISELDRTVEVAEFCNRLPVHARHPYAGELVYTSFSGSHQDAIKKGMAALDESEGGRWEVPYLPIDPADVGRSYEAVVRVNSQSGKGGVAFLLERDRGLRLPRNLQIEFSRKIQQISEASGAEITSRAIWKRFVAEYLERRDPIELLSYCACESPLERDEPVNCDEPLEHDGSTNCDRTQFGSEAIEFRILFEGNEKRIRGVGNGPIDAFGDALDRGIGQAVRIVDFSEHAIGTGAEALAIAYLEVDAGGGRTLFGVGRHANSTTACLAAMVAAANRLCADRKTPSTSKDIAP
jgi:2-isopropylmalate synthase